MMLLTALHRRLHTSKLSSFTKTSPFGVTSGTCSNLHKPATVLLDELTCVR